MDETEGLAWPKGARAVPGLQVCYTRKGKSSSKFVKKEDLPAVRKQLKNYQRMKLLMARWIDLAMELSTLRLIKETG